MPLRAKRSELIDLTVFQIHRRCAPEDGNLDLETRTLFVDFLNDTVERRERTIGNANVFANLEGHGSLWALDAILNLVQNLIDFLLGNRNRLGITKETSDFRSILNK